MCCCVCGRVVGGGRIGGEDDEGRDDVGDEGRDGVGDEGALLHK